MLKAKVSYSLLRAAHPMYSRGANGRFSTLRPVAFLSILAVPDDDLLIGAFGWPLVTHCEEGEGDNGMKDCYVDPGNWHTGPRRTLRGLGTPAMPRMAHPPFSWLSTRTLR
jgi:hypothetical protein